MNHQDLLAYFGHHKCGTSWMVEMLVDVCRKLRLKAAYVHNSDSFVEDFLKRSGLRFLFHVNANIEHVRQLPPFRGFHMVRDPRDMMVSAYFSHRFTHPLQSWLVNHRAELERLDHDQGLLYEIQGEIMQNIFCHVRTWDYHQPHVLEIRMEEMVVRPKEGLLSACEFLGIAGGQPGETQIGEEDLSLIVEKHAFSVKANGRAPGIVDSKSHYRSGRSGDWKNHFAKIHKEVFKERYQDILELLGYEENDSW
jgi:hypothetical protein